jgi:dynein heavy chain 2
LIINEIDKVEAILVPLLRLDLNKQGPRWIVQVGEKPMDYQDTFRLFLTTRDNSIQLPPHMESIVSLVNFTVTRSGLEG